MPLSAAELISFIGIVTLLVMFPGPNTILVIQSVGLSGKKSGFYNIAGIVSALYIHALISVWGLSVIIIKSMVLYQFVKYIGSGYLIYLGLASLYSAYRMNRNHELISPDHQNKNTEIKIPLPTGSHFRSYMKGFITNIFNPKVVLFFISFFPQFIRKQNHIFGDSLILIVIYSVIVVFWYSALVLFVAKFRHWLENRIIQRRIKALTGILLFGLGIKIAVQK